MTSIAYVTCDLSALIKDDRDLIKHWIVSHTQVNPNPLPYNCRMSTRHDGPHFLIWT